MVIRQWKYPDIKFIRHGCRPNLIILKFYSCQIYIANNLVMRIGDCFRIINKEKPDIIAMTGDMVSTSDDNYEIFMNYQEI